MERILRGDPGWQQAIADALARAPRPLDIPPNVRAVRGGSRTGLPDRRTMAPARPASTLLLLYPDIHGELTLPLTVTLPLVLWMPVPPFFSNRERSTETVNE